MHFARAVLFARLARAKIFSLAGQHVRDADGLVVVRAADVADAVHLVRAALGDVGNHHVVAGVQQHDDLGAGFLRRLDNRQLIGRKLQRVFAGCFTRVVERRTRLVGIALAGAAGYLINGWHSQGLPAGSIGYVYLPALLLISLVSTFTAPFGARMAHRLPVPTLKKIFAGVLLLLSAKMLHTVLGG